MDRATEEALCDAQAELCMLRIALRAFARAHPDPAGLLAAWREALAEVSACGPLAAPAPLDSEYVVERMRACAEDWTAELVELAVPASDSPLPDSPLLDTIPDPLRPVRGSSAAGGDS